MRCLLIDNYDSFTFNLYQLIYDVLGAEPIVVRNDKITWSQIEALDCDCIILSPGPGRPERATDVGVCADAIRHARVPVLGVCLGHQGIAYYCGGNVVHAPQPMHGRLDDVTHDGSELFRGIPAHFHAVRYHSLVVAEPLPPDLRCIARASDGVVMGLRHRERPLWGVQFHPESVSTEHGAQLIQNFADITRRQRHCGIWAPDEIRTNSIVPGDHRPSASSSYVLRSRQLDAMPDPEDTFVALFGNSTDPAFWLDSSLRVHEDTDARHGRFSFMGDARGPHAMRCAYRAGSRQIDVVQDGRTTVRHGELFDFLRREIDLRRVQGHGLPFDFACGFVGYLGYELKDDWSAPARAPSRQPDAQLVLADRLVAFDHLTRTTYLVALATPATTTDADAWLDEMTSRLKSIPAAAAPTASGASLELTLQRDHTTYLADIATCMEKIRDGESYEICLTNQVLARTRVDALDLYRILRGINPAPYSAFIRLPGVSIACSSPERFLKIGADGMVETKPIKGTARRGATREEDEQIKDALRLDAKCRSENLMIADLLRNDLGVVSSVGSVHVPKLMHVETYATLHQLVTTVRSRLRADITAIDCVRACFPGGSMTGAPKLRTIQIIDALETSARGIYSGAIGFFSLDGAADLNIVIRTAVIEADRVSIGAGGAITALSVPADELEEVVLKARALVRALLIATRGEPVEEELDAVLTSWRVRKLGG